MIAYSIKSTASAASQVVFINHSKLWFFFELLFRGLIFYQLILLHLFVTLHFFNFLLILFFMAATKPEEMHWQESTLTKTFQNQLSFALQRQTTLYCQRIHQAP